MNRQKNIHSPAGMGYSMHGARLTSLTDCPKCKYGTVDKRVRQEKLYYVCADCGAVWTEEQWNQLKGTK